MFALDHRVPVSRRPDQKGIETPCCGDLLRGPKLAADLIKKGLRRLGLSTIHLERELAADLIKKGLRPSFETQSASMT